MSVSSFVDGLLDSYWEVATAAVIVVVAWIVGTRCFGGRSLVRHHPRIAAIAELILAPLTVIVIGSLARLLLTKTGIAGMDKGVRILTAVCVYLAIAWCLARIIELWILSRSRVGRSEDVV